MVPAVLYRPSEYLDYLHIIRQISSPSSSRRGSLTHAQASLHPHASGPSNLRCRVSSVCRCVLRNRPRSPSPCACGISTSWRERRYSTPWPTPRSSCTRVSRKLSSATQRRVSQTQLHSRCLRPIPGGLRRSAASRSAVSSTEQLT